MGHLEAAMIIDVNQGLRAVSAKPLVRWRRLGDLNPGWARTQTALAARIVAVRIGSSWTNLFGRSSLDDAARRGTATQTATLGPSAREIHRLVLLSALTIPPKPRSRTVVP